MYLEIKIESSEPLVYALEEDSFVLGSREGADLIVGHHTISRKHLRFNRQGETWFITDLGSTNGTFIGKERLVPGQKVEFTVGEKFKLGLSVEIQLLKSSDHSQKFKRVQATEESASDQRHQESTQVISIEAFKEARAKTEEKKREDRKKKMEEALQKKMEERKRLIKVSVLTVLILTAGLLANNYWNKKEAKVSKNTLVKVLQNAGENAEVDPELEGLYIDKSELLKRDFITGLLSKTKCESEEEKAACERFHLGKEPFEGVLYHENSLLVFLQKNRWQIEARAMVDNLSSLDYRRGGKVASMAFLKEFKEDLEQIGRPHLYLVYFSESNERVTLDSVAAIKIESASRILQVFSQTMLSESDPDRKELIENNPLIIFY